MKDYLFVYRTDFNTMKAGTAAEMQAATQQWIDWIGNIKAQNKITDMGNRLVVNGRVLRSDNSFTEGPYKEIRESIGGYSIVKADSLNEATELAKGCPILESGGNVEIREISVI
ncbi:MAG: YciI family protein [Ferruginibacter sp.]